ncbi:hypothetical protein BKA63DRAFT_490338 [Paraphoma chrysanthemicola]|nr:hypothetical protein BKA63DRAFT_490338 [Paraphoma chrysanthemicola]
MFKIGMGSTPTSTSAPPTPAQKLWACIIQPHGETHITSVTWSHRIEDLNLSNDGVRAYIKKLGPDYSVISTIAQLPPSKLRIIQHHAKTQNGQLVAIQDGKEVDMATPMGMFKVKSVIVIMETSKIEWKGKAYGAPSQNPPSAPFGSSFYPEVSRYMPFPFSFNNHPEQKQSFEEQRLTDDEADRKAPFAVEKPNLFLIPGTFAAPKRTLFFGTHTFNQGILSGDDDRNEPEPISSNDAKASRLAGSAPLEGMSPPATVPVSYSPLDDTPTASSPPQAWAKFCRRPEVSNPILRALALVSAHHLVDDTKTTFSSQDLSVRPSVLENSKVDKVQNDCFNAATTSANICQSACELGNAEPLALAKQVKDTTSNEATLNTSTPSILRFNASSGVKAASTVSSEPPQSPEITLFGHRHGFLRNVGNTPVPPHPFADISAQPAGAASTPPIFRFGQFKVPKDQLDPTTSVAPPAKQRAAKDATCWLCDNKVQEDVYVAPLVQENATNVIKDDEKTAAGKFKDKGLQESVEVTKKHEPTRMVETSGTVAKQSTTAPPLIKTHGPLAAEHKALIKALNFDSDDETEEEWSARYGRLQEEKKLAVKPTKV